MELEMARTFVDRLLLDATTRKSCTKSEDKKDYACQHRPCPVCSAILHVQERYLHVTWTCIPDKGFNIVYTNGGEQMCIECFNDVLTVVLEHNMKQGASMDVRQCLESMRKTHCEVPDEANEFLVTMPKVLFNVLMSYLAYT